MQKHVLHPWHGVTPGEEAPRVVNAIIEILKAAVANMKLINLVDC
jgi:inorganic pyrophosphatase